VLPTAPFYEKLYLNFKKEYLDKQLLRVIDAPAIHQGPTPVASDQRPTGDQEKGDSTKEEGKYQRLSELSGVNLQVQIRIN